ncbi:carbohydrate esterase family 5 protein [Saccharata proteae CBS 121410]|uniref:Carbohydrate esterase family 5 protein n=1 Tax=Saccharata proteae CBS 121410 TaxID=1314787 RepID=A0A9P4HZF2_9PEZI|nr:carbohydrate esterase family 5 protein [Saccharata proteae CBS 121410]
MFISSFLTTAILAHLTTSSPTPFLETRQITCAPVHIITARGSTEPQGNGALSSLVALIQKAHPSATTEAVVYPATLDNYSSSSSNGAAALTAQLTKYVEACPCSEIVLLGYSQGAQVIGDSLCGGGAVIDDAFTEPIDRSIGDHGELTAIVQFGDPRFIKGLSFDKGNNTVSDGIFPRPAKISCDHYADKIHSYCDQGDPFCADGNELLVHVTYPERYNNAAVGFVNEKL